MALIWPVLFLLLITSSQPHQIARQINTQSFVNSLSEIEELNEDIWTGYLVRNEEAAISATFFYDILSTSNLADVHTDCFLDISLVGASLASLKKNGTKGMDNFTHHAVLPMVDSSGKIPEPGILRGRLIFSGHFSQCIRIDYPVEGMDRHFKGDYFRLFMDPLFRPYGTNGSCEVSLGGISVFIGLDLYLPASCKSSDIERMLHGLPEKHATPVCKVSGVNDHIPPYDTTYYVIFGLLIAVAATCVVAGIIDYFFTHRIEIRHGMPYQILMAHSMYRNTQEIFNINTANKRDVIGPLHCIRFFSMCWVVLGHTTLTYLIDATNFVDIHLIIHDLTTEFINNAFFSVDSFFFSSGLLVSFIWFKNYNRNPRKTNSLPSWIMFYIHRILRLSPAYFIMILFYTFVYEQWLSNMPMHLSDQYPKDYEVCRKNWWINLLYLNNYVKHHEQCFGVSWYLATDMQMYLFTPLLLVPLAMKPVIGLAVSALLFLASTAANIATIYIYHFPPSDSFLGKPDPNLKPEDSGKYDVLMYNAPYIRCQVYIMGIVVGWMLQRYKKMRIHPVLNIACWLLGLSLMLTVVLGLHSYNDDMYLSVFWRAMYSSLSRPAWGLGLSWIIISCYYGYGGPINDFMSWWIWAPFGRLTYCGYLVHVPVYMYFYGLSSDRWTFTGFTELFTTRVLPYIALTFAGAFVWSAFFEIPFGKIEMLLLGGMRAGGRDNDAKKGGLEEKIMEEVEQEEEKVQDNREAVNGENAHTNTSREHLVAEIGQLA